MQHWGIGWECRSSAQLSITRSLWHRTGNSRQHCGLARKPWPELGSPQPERAELLGYVWNVIMYVCKAQGQEPWL